MALPGYLRRFAMSADLAQDRRLGPQAIGVATFLTSRCRHGTRTVEITIAEIAEAMGCGRSRVEAALKVLRQHGYLELEQIRENARFAGTAMHLLEPALTRGEMT